jgi:hypothetical protein
MSKNKVVFFFETHRHIGHIERVIFFKIKLNLKSNTPFYVSYVPMCFQKKINLTKLFFTRYKGK